MARKDKIRGFRKIARKRTRKRLFKRSGASVSIKEVPRDHLDTTGVYQYILYTNDKRYGEYDNVRHSRELKEFLKTSMSGRYRIHYASNQWTTARWITSIKLVDDTDLFTLMLCHNEMFRKILKLTDEKEPT
jgi:hypothetical protein